MAFERMPRIRALVASLTLGVAAVLAWGSAGTALAAKPNPTNNVCPSTNAVDNYLPATNVAAWSTDNGAGTRTYYFRSLTDESPVRGVPGLVKYCVYATTEPASHTVTVNSWTYASDPYGFVFMRTGGNKNNVPLNGAVTPTTIGTATWASAGDVPAEEILLHINDATVCSQLYGGDPGTCWVRPAAAICDIGSGGTDYAYNANPYDVTDCGPGGLGFESDSMQEFGDRVSLDTTTGTKLDSLQIVLASYACQAGHWWTGCESGDGATFQHPVTANIYAVADTNTGAPGELLATATQTFDIPYRPTADSALCTGADAGKWFNELANRCQYAIATLLTFNTFPTGITLPSQVIWTVTFNTTHYGYDPIGESPACFSSAAGCPYDSLNVGTRTYTDAPYAGTDVSSSEVYIASTWPGGTNGPYCDGSTTGDGTLGEYSGSCWDPYKPLGAIATTT